MARLHTRLYTIVVFDYVDYWLYTEHRPQSTTPSGVPAHTHSQTLNSRKAYEVSASASDDVTIVSIILSAFHSFLFEQFNTRIICSFFFSTHLFHYIIASSSLCLKRQHLKIGTDWNANGGSDNAVAVAPIAYVNNTQRPIWIFEYFTRQSKRTALKAIYRLRPAYISPALFFPAHRWQRQRWCHSNWTHLVFWAALLLFFFLLKYQQIKTTIFNPFHT